MLIYILFLIIYIKCSSPGQDPFYYHSNKESEQTSENYFYQAECPSNFIYSFLGDYERDLSQQYDVNHYFTNDLTTNRTLPINKTIASDLKSFDSNTEIQTYTESNKVSKNQEECILTTPPNEDISNNFDYENFLTEPPSLDYSPNDSRYLFNIDFFDQDKMKFDISFKNEGNLTDFFDSKVQADNSKVQADNSKAENAFQTKQNINFISDLPENYITNFDSNQQTITSPPVSIKKSQARKQYLCTSDKKLIQEASINPVTTDSFESPKKRARFGRPQKNLNRIAQYNSDCAFLSIDSGTGVNFLHKFEWFIQIFESLLYTYLVEKTLNAQTNIEELLYSPKLCIINGFSFNTFGKCSGEIPDLLKMVSSTADMLNSFIGSLESDKLEHLMQSLKSCLGLNTSQMYKNEYIANLLNKDLIDFLKSEESKYLKSISTELYSFVTFFDELHIYYDFRVVKGFIAFLILVKRNRIITPILKENLAKSAAKYQKDFIFDEIRNNSAIFYVFLNNWPFMNAQNILTNMGNYIFFNSVEYCIKRGKNMDCDENVLITRHLFFYLRGLKIDSLCSKLESPFAGATGPREIRVKLLNDEQEATKMINSLKTPILKELEPFLLTVNFAYKQGKTILDSLKTSESLSISRFRSILEFKHILYIYNDCNMTAAIRLHFNFFSRSTKSGNRKQIQ